MNDAFYKDAIENLPTIPSTVFKREMKKWLEWVYVNKTPIIVTHRHLGPFVVLPLEKNSEV